MRLLSVLERHIGRLTPIGRGRGGWIQVVALVAFALAISPAIWKWYATPPAETTVPLSELVATIDGGRAGSISDWI